MEPDWAPVARRIRDEATDSWDDKAAVDRFTQAGGQFFRSTGRITAPGRVTAGEHVLRARRAIILNTGTEPAVPPVEGLAGTPYWTNRDAIEATHVPDSLLVLGGGSIGTELAQVFARFGAVVTVIEGAGQLLPQEEPEAGALLAGVFARDGIGVRTATTARAVRHDGISFTVDLSDGTRVAGDALLVATGRRTNLAGAGVGALGLDETARAIPVDDHMRVPAGPGWAAGPAVFAIGDMTGHGAFTHMSMYQAGIVVAGLLGHEVSPAEYHAGAPGHLHRPRDRVGRDVRAAGPGAGHPGRHRIREAPGFRPGLDSQGRQRRVHQAGRGLRPGRAGRCHLGRPVRR